MNNSYLLVDLDQIERNARTVLASLGGGVQLIPVLKDDAYGLGLIPVARRLAGLPQVELLAVAHVSEGAQLRRGGIGKDVLVMGGVPTSLLPDAAQLDLTVAVGRLGMVPVLAREAAALGRQARVHIKIETGLHRIGLLPGRELDLLMDELRRAAPLVRVTGAFSHFADPADEERTLRQRQDLLAGADQLARGGFAAPLLHLTASQSSEERPQLHLGGARIGRRLYFDHPTRPLGGIREAASWRTWVTNVRALKAGDGVGYGGRCVLDRDALVATLAVGYGDGLNQELCRVRGPVLIGGRRCPLLGCCMDQAFADVTGLDCRPDDQVTLFGYDGAGGFLSAQEVSLLVGEDEGCGLTAALSPRVARVYVPEAP